MTKADVVPAALLHGVVWTGISAVVRPQSGQYYIPTHWLFAEFAARCPRDVPTMVARSIALLREQQELAPTADSRSPAQF
ncbi:MAG: hypothetical protein M3P52_01410, partial [Actinomycetota bacterium]|nr:hypothetical protein [Actinomycetota bacterium]